MMHQKKEVNVRQATLSDKPAIFEFLRLAYPGRWENKFPERWEWEFERNPFWQSEGLPIWIALDGARVVGQSCALVEPLVIQGKECRVGWGVDFFVLPEYRGQGLGTRLQQANNAGNEVFMSLSMAAAAARIKSAIGLQPLPEVPVFMKILDHEPESVLRTLAARTKLPENVLRRIGIHRLVARLLIARDTRRDRDLLARPFDFQPSTSAQDKPSGEIEVIPIRRFGPDVDALWERVSGRFTCLVRRDSTYLNWKFTEQPHMEHERVIGQREGKAFGYAIFRRARLPERNAGLILDVFVDPADTEGIRVLLTYAVQQLRAQGVTYILAASSVPAYQQALIALRFKQTRAVTPMIRAGRDVPLEGWLLGKGDHDWDQFPLA